MSYQAVFKRHEIKFMLTLEQKALLLKAMAPHMSLDAYGRTTIRNVYFDTDTYRLIRHSMEKMAYKEKLRVRSYAQAGEESPVFVELKKKARSVVYKRRLALPERRAMDWLAGRCGPGEDSQIAREIAYFLAYYGTLRPAVFLSYEREAFASRDGSDFRVTFDENILCREEALTLEAPVWGRPILEPGTTLMELKTSGGIPLFMTHALAKEGIYRTSFSKYAQAYRMLIFPQRKGERQYA